MLSRELLLMTDHHTESLFSTFANSGDTVVTSPVSRLLVDMERFEDDASEPMDALGMGVVYRKTADGHDLKKISWDLREELLRQYYRPHHERITSSVLRELHQGKCAKVIDCHSFSSRPLPYEDAQLVRPDICIGSDEFHTHSLLVERMQARATCLGLSVAINQPFSGSIVPQTFWRKDSRVVSVMIEVNRKLYMDEATGGRLLSGEYQETQNNLGCLVEVVRGFNESSL